VIAARGGAARRARGARARAARRQRRRPVGAREVAACAAAALALELAAAALDPLVADVGYALLVVAVATRAAQALAGPGRGRRRAVALAALAIPPSLRLSSLTLEAGQADALRHYALVGLAAAAATATALRAVPELRPRLGRLAGDRTQLAIALAGLPAGLACALAFAPSSLAPQQGVWRSAVPLAALLAAAAVVEEVLFRGVVQSALRTLVGRAAPFAGTAALALAYLGASPPGFVAAALALGLGAALAVERTGVLAGVLAARLLFLVGLVDVWPRVLHLQP